MSTSSALEAQIAALLQRLEETKEAEQRENEHKEAERKEVERKEAEQKEAERREAERKEAEAQAARVSREVERRREEQARREEAARQAEACHESSPPVIAPETELPRSKGKELENGPETEAEQESQKCDSCVKRNAECIRIKVSPTCL